MLGKWVSKIKDWLLFKEEKQEESAQFRTIGVRDREMYELTQFATRASELSEHHN